MSVILASGGLDSFLCWALCAKDSLNVFVNIGHKYAKKELESLNQLKQLPNFKLQIVIGADLGHLELPSGIIPLRNAHLLLGAAQYDETILIGSLHGEINSDKSRIFYDQMEQVLTTSWRGQYWNDGKSKVFHILTPLSNMTKTEAIALYLQQEGDPTWLDLTVSCYSNMQGHCGQCPSCFKRWVAYVNNGLQFISITDPLQYSQLSNIISKCKNGIYSQRRADEILLALRKVEYVSS